jgi:anti-anti-sigma factor
VKEAIYYKEENEAFYIKASGHITASLCTDLKKIIFDRLDRPPNLNALYVDLSYCNYMDSTFMGLLVGLNKKLLNIVNRPVILLHPNIACLDLLKNLGIDKLFNIENKNINFPEQMNIVSQTVKATAEFLLKTHENLIELSELNKEKFSALQSILKKQLKKQKNNS